MMQCAFYGDPRRTIAFTREDEFRMKKEGLIATHE